MTAQSTRSTSFTASLALMGTALLRGIIGQGSGNPYYYSVPPCETSCLILSIHVLSATCPSAHDVSICSCVMSYILCYAHSCLCSGIAGRREVRYSLRIEVVVHRTLYGSLWHTFLRHRLWTWLLAILHCHDTYKEGGDVWLQNAA